LIWSGTVAGIVAGQRKVQLPSAFCTELAAMAVELRICW
jgi:hypothetical protein